MSAPWPEPVALTALFQRLCEGDPLAQSAFATAVLEPLVAHLRRSRSGADEHAYLTAAEDAVLSLIRKPESYDPTKRSLIGFLRMAAEGDLLNAFQNETKHTANRERSDCVELVATGGNTVADDLPSFDDPDLAAEITTFSPAERAVFELMRAGERSTARFAAALDVERLPAAEQATEVKRVKDRLIKRLQRARGKA